MLYEDLSAVERHAAIRLLTVLPHRRRPTRDVEQTANVERRVCLEVERVARRVVVVFGQVLVELGVALFGYLPGLTHPQGLCDVGYLAVEVDGHSHKVAVLQENVCINED